MSRFSTILFDADDTLFDFKQAESYALRAVLDAHGLFYLQEDLTFYQQSNEALWKRLEQGLISRKELQDTRFAPLLSRLRADLNPLVFNQEYLNFLGNACFLMPDALSVCRALSRKAKLAIVTNGVTRVQRNRLRLSPIAPYISRCFVSEEIGYQKPRREFFTVVFQAMRIEDRSSVLIVGDSPTSDIQGGINAGISTCWYAPSRGQPPIPCDFQITSLTQLINLI